MKKSFIFTFLIILLSCNNISYSWDSTSASYLPLKVGNIWVYRTYKQTPTWQCYAYEKYTITSTAQINNKIYYVVSNNTNLYYQICTTWAFPVKGRLFRKDYLRIDSLTTNIYSTETCVIDSLSAMQGDSIRVCPYIYTPVLCDTSIQLIFGFYKPAKTFIFTNFETSEVMWYIKDFGFVRYHLNQAGPYMEDMLLRGCVINGVVYGDTNTLVGINQISLEVPEQFNLYQNYPNPFNPATKIKFDVPPSPQGNLKAAGLGVKLIIYDILGREIKTLVNEQLQPGTYEVDFDGTSYPSGVYFYRLVVGDASASFSTGFTETKKMILIK